MAVCMEDVLENALVEQNEEVVVLESIYGDNFNLIQHEDGESNNQRIEFNLSLNVHHPHKKIIVEAVIPVVVSQTTVSNSSSSDSEENEHVDVKEREIVVQSKIINENDALEKVPESGTSCNNLTDPGGSQRKNPGLSRLLSTKHWHIQSEVSSLTPIHLFCKFHPLYPAESPPEFNIYCDWLSECQIQELSKVLEELWQNNGSAPVVFTWAEWLQNSSWEFLSLSSHVILKEGFKENLYNDYEEPDSLEVSVNNSALELALLNIFEYDVAIKRREFFKVQHTCEICFEDQEGQEFCLLDECHHYCCLQCLKLHCEMHIKSGTVTRLMCPTHGCTETIPPQVLQEILEEETYKRWERLLLSRTLDMMRDVYYCPRCNNVVVADEDESSRLAQCATCFYSFCTECQGPWHATQSCEGEEEEEKKQEVKKKKRKKKRKNLEGGDGGDGNDDEEEEVGRKVRKQQISSAKFIATMKNKGMYRNCPKCKMVIEKTTGCNFMTCSHCHGTFCWICGKSITSYSHFTSSPKCTTFANPDPVVVRHPRPSEGELLIRQFKKDNPGKTVRLKKCPTCSQKNIKALNNNHLKCWSCKTRYCYQCGKKIEASLKHFMPPSLCTQHSDN